MRVVVVDSDPRATATDELGVEVGRDTLTLNDLLYLPEDPDIEPTNPAEVIWDVLQRAGSAWPSNVRVIAAERKLANREMDPRPFEGRLRLGLAALSGEVDLVLGDMAPRPGGRLVNSVLAAMRKTLIPTTLTTDGYEGVKHTLRSIQIVKAGGGHAPDVVGIVRSMVPRDSERRGVHDSFDDLLEESYGPLLLDVQIVNYAIREEARAAAIPITAAPGKSAKRLVELYGQVLDHVLTPKLETTHA
jgi:chromosome partitioning protein